MKILLTGSSGFIGRQVSTALEADGHEVVGVNRADGCDFNHMLKASDWLPFLQSIDVVINCVGIIVETEYQRFDRLHNLAPSALFCACDKVGIARVIQVSALGADDQAFTEYQLSKKAADDVLRQLSCDWFILRPSLVYGEAGRSTRFFNRLARFPVLPLLDGGQQQVQPVHIDDLVCAIQACLTAEPARRTIDIVGPQVFSFAAWIQQLRQHLGKTPAFIVPIPFLFMLPVAYLIHHVLPLFHPDNLRMLQQGNTASSVAMTQLIGRCPRDIP
ncbi:MAG: NAD-dependent epimerase/dehydratase family protein [Gammaproteobacteria bacterium]|nr:NAD-dependent epimerase/dehydratase family protein [Gammaproteobacteria bacterium]MDH5800421.1 NAD-dependent epimerase/dehydratase family protein [Gammaproteobacteria bacterium]